MAVCNHGFFMMAPNRWIPSTNTLQRPLRLADLSSSVEVPILQPPGPNRTLLLVRVHRARRLSSQETVSDFVTLSLSLTMSVRTKYIQTGDAKGWIYIIAEASDSDVKVVRKRRAEREVLP
ncbi:hypothetical protein ACJRO7_010531 [Eucalyptus globulus]|uniref:Uncharacterized protein n=1 Tax=Eucalyptus globulus TaxID=34317 RepID=A0ABD3LC94_EUCGL